MKCHVKLALFLSALFIANLAIAHAQEISPVGIVTLFNRWYGNHCMDEIADYTTATFKGTKQKSVWVVDTWKALRKMNDEKINSSILDSKVKGDRAVVIVNTTFSTVGGEASKKETFYLVKEADRWLIDELVVTDEEIDGDKIQL